jgi:hypothetical protein
LRALVTRARPHLAGHARLHNVVFDTGLLEGVEPWWLAQRDMLSEHRAGGMRPRPVHLAAVRLGHRLPVAM